MKSTSRLAVALACAGLLGCAAGGKPRNDDAFRLAAEAFSVRSSQLLRQAQWGLSGRFAVSDGDNSGSAAIEWLQDGANYTITVRAPVSGQTWRLSGDSELCQLEGGKRGAVVGTDPEELLLRETGYRLPLRAMRSWLRGLASDSAHSPVEFDVQGLPRRIDELGWRVDYLDWDRQQPVALPLRLRASRLPYELRLAVTSWNPHAVAP